MFIVPIQAMQAMTFSESGTTLAGETKKSAFHNVLNDAINTINETQARSRRDAYHLAMGDVDNIAELMINTLKAETMVQTTVQITSRVISAYKEILNIQV